ncbi:hypothetical protein CCH79_00008585 [Gambusia affinis]|uniref:Uncharacterized protein n=1 Tax=Gambusia affinis TaxID=33528 RepID=A0A315UX41_GAMAF|nr:hypothetical protein CCH79_00008585 [Gambusia affinis]
MNFEHNWINNDRSFPQSSKHVPGLMGSGKETQLKPTDRELSIHHDIHKLQLQLKNRSTCPTTCCSENTRRSIELFLSANTKLSEEDVQWRKDLCRNETKLPHPFHLGCGRSVTGPEQGKDVTEQVAPGELNKPGMGVLWRCRGQRDPHLEDFSPCCEGRRSRMSFKLKLLALQLSATVGLLLVLQFNELSQLQFQDLCACDSCVSENKGSLSGRLNRSVEPVLSWTTDLSEEAFSWWKSLQNERRDFRFFKKTVHKLFQIFPRRTELRKQNSGTCRTCAVVGNSVNLKGSHYGPLIDYQDVVMRMNIAKTNGYEEDVGTRTTYHVMYPESATDLHNSTHLVFFPFKIMDLEWLIKAFTTGFYGRVPSSFQCFVGQLFEVMAPVSIAVCSKAKDMDLGTLTTSDKEYLCYSSTLFMRDRLQFTMRWKLRAESPNALDDMLKITAPYRGLAGQLQLTQEVETSYYFLKEFLREHYMQAVVIEYNSKAPPKCEALWSPLDLIKQLMANTVMMSGSETEMILAGLTTMEKNFLWKVSLVYQGQCDPTDPAYKADWVQSFKTCLMDVCLKETEHMN